MKRFLIIPAFLLSLSAHAADDIQNFKIDPAHTSVVFRISHLGFSQTYGQFPAVEGSFIVNETKPEASSLEVSLDASKITTHNEKRDKHLMSPDFFNTKQFGKITYKSKSVKKSGNKYEISGDFTMHGVTKPLSVTFERGRTGKDPWGSTRTGGNTSFKVKRSDFGMNFMQGENQVGDEVEVMVSLEGIKQ